MGLSGVAEVNMHIHKARNRTQPLGVDDFAVGAQTFADFGDFAVANKNVKLRVQPVCRRNNLGIFY